MSNKPSYNNYSSQKNYRSVVFTAGSKLQSAELNELQDIQLGYTSKLGNFLVSNGTILSGGEVLTLNKRQIIIEESTISVQGLPVYTPGATIDLSGLQETIGVLVEETIVTGADDRDILQPDPESPFYNEETSYRKKVVGRWVKSSDVKTGQLYFPVHTIENGSIISSSANTNENRDYINKSISSYDKGVHGSYVVEGLNLKATNLTRSDNKHSVELTSGLCRVNGDEVKVATSRILTLDPVTENVRPVSSEPIIFIQGTSEYTLRNLPPKSVTSVVGTKEVTETITRGGYAGGEDTIPNTPVLRIVEVKQGSKVFSSGADFIQTGDKISWSPSGQEPSPGSQYTIKYQYMSTFNASVTNTKLVLNTSDTAALVHNTQLSVSYEFYLSRMDRIIVKNGEVVVVKGIPDTPLTVIPPSVDRATELSLGVVKLMYGQDPVISQDDMVTMIPFSELKKMQNQLADVQYNIAQLALKDEAREMDMVTSKRGVIVDSLANENMRDKGITQNARVLDGILDIGSNFGTQKILNTSFISLDTQLEYDLFSQTVQTNDQRINPYATTESAPTATCTINPSVVYGNMWEPGYEGQELPRAFKVTVKLDKFNSAEQVKIRFRNADVATVATDNNGSATYELTLPAGLAYSNYEVHAKGLISGAVGIGVFVLKRNDETYNSFYTQLNLARQAEINARLEQSINDLAEDVERELNDLEQRVTNLESEVQRLDQSLNAITQAMNQAFQRVNARIDELDGKLEVTNSQLNALANTVARQGQTIDAMGRKIDQHGRLIDQQGRLINEQGRILNNHEIRISDLEKRANELARNMPSYWVHYYDPVSNRSDPSQFLKAYASTEYSEGAISFNAQTGNHTTQGSQLWEMGVIVTETVSKSIVISYNDDFAGLFIDGKPVSAHQFQPTQTPRTINFTLTKGHHVIQWVLNDKGNWISQLRTSGNIVDKQKVFFNPDWAKQIISDAERIKNEHEANLARQRAEEERRRQQAQSRLRRLRMTDPVAQSFIPQSNVDISAVSCFLTELPTKMLYCKIVENTAGQPDIFKLVGYGEIPRVSSLKLGWNKIPLESKVSLTQDKEYSIIIITESFEGKVAIAKVGERDVKTNTYVKTQTDSGVMFLSANERTWTPVQDSDMVYKIHGVNYNTSKVVRIGTITAAERQNNLTDFRLLGQVKTNESTSARFYMMVNRQRIDLALNRTIFTTPITKAMGTIEVFAELNTSSQSYSPTIDPGMLLLAGTAVTPSTYVMRQFPIKNGQVSPAAIQIILDELVESGCTIVPALQTGNGDTDFTNVTTVKSSDPIGNNWRTTVYEHKGIQRANSRLKLTLTTTHHENRPKVKNIRVVVIDNY